MQSISLEEQRNPNFLNRDTNTNKIQTQCPSTEIHTFASEQLLESEVPCTINAD